jgi:CRISPR-associated exonuclease Cas4
VGLIDRGPPPVNHQAVALNIEFHGGGDVYSEDDLLQLSLVQHMLYCERQAALIHLEQAWANNVYTTEGNLMHERAHGGETELRGEILTVRTVRLRSLRLGLSGQADIVEFHRTPEGVAIPGRNGLWLPFPVEYKRGKPKRDPVDEVQLCAQAICLEEMLGVAVPGGALFYGQTKRRTDVDFGEGLRRLTEKVAQQLHAMIKSGATPSAIYSKAKCEKCSLIDICLPRQHPGPKSAKAWFELQLAEDSGRENPT